MRIMKTRIYVINLLAVLLLLVPLSMMAQSDWMVSEDKQADKNPIAFSEESVKAGKVVFMANCKSCHGDPTKANGLPLVPPPTDLGMQAFLDKNTDGSIFHKVTDGKATMPQYGSILSEDDRWNVVNYIRSFDANFEAPAASSQPSEDVAQGDASGEFTAPYELSLSVDQSNHKAIASLKGTQNGQLVAMPNVEVFIGIKRYFSNLPVISAGASTNDGGTLEVEYPHDLPGNEEGKGYMVAYLVDSDKFGEVMAEAEIELEAIHPVDFSSIRALWADNQSVPIWLIVTYLSIVLIVWGTMFKVVLNIIKIKKIGN